MPLRISLTRRAGYPGWNSSTTRFNWLGLNQTAALAYHFSLRNPNASPSYLEQLLPNELLNYTDVRSTPYSPTQSSLWYYDLFPNQYNYPVPGTTASAVPLRTMITGDNPVSNGASSRFQNSSSTTVPSWTAGVQYNFG